MAIRSKLEFYVSHTFPKKVFYFYFNKMTIKIDNTKVRQQLNSRQKWQMPENIGERECVNMILQFYIIYCSIVSN